MVWAEHAIWWQVYPLGAVGAPIRDPDAPGVHHRLPALAGWLDHLVGLGANGLLLGPVFASATHGYDTLDHRQVDPRLGDDDDLVTLIDAAHARGVRVALDGVFNHVAAGHPLVVQALADGPGGRYADWFRIDWDAPDGPRPQVFEGHSDLVALNHAHDEVRDFVVDVMTHWCARGVDAWRLDAAYAVEPSFWAYVLPRVRATYPDVWFLAEVIHGDYAAFVTTSTVDTVTQYELWKAIWSSLVDRNFYELDHALGRHRAMLDAFVPATFVGNHDVTRISTRVGGDGAVLALVVLATVGGVPTIYAGDELAVPGEKTEGWGGDDAVRPALPDPPGFGDGAWMYRAHQDLLGLRRRHPWLVTARTSAVELSNTRYVYLAQGDGGALRVELDVSEHPRARVLGPDGQVLFTWG